MIFLICKNVTKFGINWPSDSSFIFVNVDRYFGMISPWKMAGPFIWKNLNPFTQGCCLPLLVDVNPVVLKKKNLFRQCVCTISLLSPFWKGRNSSTEQTWIPFTQGRFVPSVVEIGPVVLEKKMQMWTFYRQMDGRRTTAWAFSSGKLKTNRRKLLELMSGYGNK